jgi:DNA replication protein DnaC
MAASHPSEVWTPCDCGRGKRRGYSVGGRSIFAGKCELCQREAQEAEAERERAKAEREERERLESRTQHVAEILGRFGVTRKYHTVTLGTFNGSSDPHALKAAQELVRDYLRGDRTSLYLYSERPGETIAPGCGKTHLAVGILHALAMNPDVPLGDLGFAFVPRMLLEIQATFKHPERSELSIVKKYAKPELLVWDDFGAEKLSDYAARTLYTILYEREGRSNVFTSNLSLGSIEDRDPTGYTQRITSRIAGDARIIRMSGPDRRLNPRAA